MPVDEQIWPFQPLPCSEASAETYFPFGNMTSSLFLIVCYLLARGALSSLIPFDTPEGLIEEEHTIKAGLIRGKFLELRPEQYLSATNNNTLLVFMHGAFTNRRQVLQAQSILFKAIEDNFLILSINVLDWLWWFDRHAKYVESVVQWSFEERGVDPSRVVCVSPSSGGVMMMTVLLEKPGLFRAGAAILSNLPISLKLKYKADRYIPTPIQFLHGTKDLIHPYKGGFAVARLDPVLSAGKTVQFWIDINLTNSTAVSTDFPDRCTEDKSTARRGDFMAPGPKGADVSSIIVTGAGHVIPGLKCSSPEEQGFFNRLIGGQNGDIDAYVEAWKFVSSYLP